LHSQKVAKKKIGVKQSLKKNQNSRCVARLVANAKALVLNPVAVHRAATTTD
jgi:hypothetical protein